MADETVKVFDLTKGAYVDKPASEITPPIDPNEPPADDDPTDTPPANDNTDPAPAAGGEPAKPAEGGEPAKPDETKNFEPGSYLTEKWGKYGVKGEEDVEKVFQAKQELEQQASKLTTELESLKAAPKYRTEQEKKVAEFLAPFDPTKFGEGLNTVAELMAMDPDNVSERRALEENYILKHPDLTREESKELFAEEFDKNYKVNRDDFDSEEDFNKRKRIVEIKLKNEVAQSRKELKEKKEALKYVPPANEGKKDEQPFTAPKEAVDSYSKEINSFFDDGKGRKFNGIQYFSDDGKEMLFNLVIPQDKIDSVKEYLNVYVQNPTSYTKEGKIPNFAPAELVKTVTRLLHGDWMEEQLLKQVDILASKKKAEQIAGQSPDKRSGAQGDAKLSVSEQFAKLAQKEKEKRTR